MQICVLNAELSVLNADLFAVNADLCVVNADLSVLNVLWFFFVAVSAFFSLVNLDESLFVINADFL